jgi:CMP-N-acetylneuraminic acid synthetase
MKKTYKNRFHLIKQDMEKKYGPNVNIYIWPTNVLFVYTQKIQK